MSAIRLALSNPDRCQDVIEHRLVFCDMAQHMATEDLLLDCWCCDRFFAYCCACTERRRAATETARRRYRRAPSPDTPPPKPCHYYKVVFVDGACLGNGQEAAMAGIGIAIGLDAKTMHWAIPIDDDIDPLAVRTSQRAELLAAIHGIRKLAEYEAGARRPGDTRETHDASVTWVVTSDSEYVVVGMTEWVPAWKSNAWRNASNKKPKNLDLFQRLDSIVEYYENEYGVRIAFWRINRVYNELADGLAGFAAKGHTVEPLQTTYPLTTDVIMELESMSSFE